jgi:two-component system nitrogen regulation sensor histidine kinase GlnL
MADKMDRQLTQRNAAVGHRDGNVLAHGQNPLSGFAARHAPGGCRCCRARVTQLICDETDRIVALVDRMEASDYVPIIRAEVNIPGARCARSPNRALPGMSRSTGLTSLPPVWRPRPPAPGVSQSVKNAAGRCRAPRQIVLTSAYRHGPPAARRRRSPPRR